MAKISSFMICDTIVNLITPQGISVPQLISPQPILRPPFIPGSFSFGISIGVLDIDYKISNVVKTIIYSPEGVEIHNSGNIDLGKIPKDEFLPEKYQGFVLSTDIRNLIIHEEGIYTIEIFVNDTSVGKKEIPVFKRD